MHAPKKGVGEIMSNLRLRATVNGNEVEVEGSDSSIVLREFAALSKRYLDTPDDATGRPPDSKRKPSTHDNPKLKAPGEASDGQSFSASAIANSVHESDEHAAIDREVLGKRDRVAKVLLCIDFAQRSGVSSVSAKQIELITSELGIRIDQANVAKVLRESARSLVEAIRSEAVATFRLNRRGKDFLTNLLTLPAARRSS